MAMNMGTPAAFFFSYILVQVPATIFARYFPPRFYIGTMAIGWGLCSTLMATGFNFPGLIVARVGLGVFEAGFGPGIPVYMALFYSKNEMGLRMAYWFGFAAVAGAFGGLVAFGVQHIHAAVHDWRLLFIIEGIPAILLGLVAMVWLPDRPENPRSARFFTEEQRGLQIARMNRYSSRSTPGTVNKKHVLEALTDWRVYLGGVMYFGFNCALASTSAFLPTILTTLGFSNANAQLLTVPPYALAAVMLLSISWYSDRINQRGVFIFACSVLVGVGYILLDTVLTTGVRYFAVFCVIAGTYTCIGLTIAWYAHNLGSETKKAAGVPMFMAIGQCGSVLGSHIYPNTDKPRYIKGFTIGSVLMFIAGFVALGLSIYYRIENKRRDKLHGNMQEGKVETDVDADRSLTFRYMP